MVAYPEWLLCNLPCPRKKPANKDRYASQFLALLFFFFFYFLSRERAIGEWKTAMPVNILGTRKLHSYFRRIYHLISLTLTIKNSVEYSDLILSISNVLILGARRLTPKMGLRSAWMAAIKLFTQLILGVGMWRSWDSGGWMTLASDGGWLAAGKERKKGMWRESREWIEKRGKKGFNCTKNPKMPL